MTPEIVYIGRDNAIVLQLEDNNTGALAPTNLSGATKVEVIVDGVEVYASDLHPEVVAFDPSGTVTIKLGMVITEPDDHLAEIVVYDATNTNGIAWQPKLALIAQRSAP